MTERRGLLGRGSFVGRSGEMRALVDGLEAALDGRGGVALVGGEPGSGKTRLAEELTGIAREQGFRVAWGRCWEEGGAPAYWPWAQCLRSLLRADGSGPPATVGPDLAAIAPDLHPSVPAGTASADPEAARFRLFDAAAHFFHAAATAWPLVLVLDDLHAADEPSLLLLRFLAGDVGDARLLVLGTYRDVAALPGNPLAETLGELARHGNPRRLTLGGLERDDIARYVALTSGAEPHPDLVAAIHAETEGNPLFVTELVRLLASEGRLDASFVDRRPEVPTGVREAIAGRLRQLPDRCRAVLTVASVVGRDFDLGTVGRATGLGSDELLEALDEAVMSRIVVESPGSAGRLRFAHAVVRDAIYDSVPSAKRVRLHARIAEILERHLGEPDLRLSEIAHHSLRAAPVMDVARAVEHVRRAGDQAMGLLAWEEAIRWYDGALQLADRNATRCELLLSKGDALVKSGAFPRAQEVFLEARALAGGSPVHAARAALGYGGRFAWLRAGHDSRLIPMLEEALSALGEEDTDLRVRLMSRLSGALRDDPDRAPREALSREAVDMARRLGDPDTLAYALVARYTAIWGPDNGEELLDIATEVVELGKRRGDRDRLLEGTLLRHKALMQLGDLRAARVELATAERLTAELRQPAQRWYVAADRSALALLEGRLDDAERLIDEALEVGGEAQGMEARSTRVLQLWALRREQARLPEVEALVRHAVDEFPWYPLFRCLLANVQAELGEEGPARAAVAELAADGFRVIPVDNEWLFAMALLAEPVAALHERRAAEALYALLLPFEGLNAYSAPELSLGAVDRSLGLLAASLGRWDDADRHLEAAARVNERMEANAWLIRTRHDHARVLAARGRPGDGERAASVAAAAHEAASRAGMRDVEGRLAELMSSGAEEGASAVFRKEGEYWSVAFEGRGFRLRDTKGLHYLAALLAAPGREIHAMDLLTARAADPVDAGAAREAGLVAGTPDGGDELLDARARESYRRRLADLEEEIDEAESWSDPERAARAREEREAIVEQLAAATGLGGRDRKTVSAAERARVNITRSIRSALARIAEHHTELGRHLERTVRTGTFCSYAPDPRAPVAWDTAAVRPS